SQVTFEPGTNFLRLADAVPASALKTPDGQPGVKGEYFASTDLSGTPLLTKVYARLDFNIRGSGLARAIEAQGAKSSRFSGTLTPDESGTYEIGMGTPNTKLWLDGTLIVDNTI